MTETSSQQDPNPAPQRPDARSALGRGLAWLASGCIRLYRCTLSPVLHFIGGPGAGCRFDPSCSRYALECLRVHPFPRACGLILRRILRCHPFHPGGHDPVPPPQS